MTDRSEIVAANYRRILLIASVGAIGGFLFGLETAIISVAIVQLKKEWSLDPLTVGTIVTGVLWGGLIGAAIAGKAADTLGREATISATAAVFVVGSFWAGLADSPLSLIAGRFVVGIAVGSVSVAVPLYLSEIAPAKIRGAVVTLNQLALVIGVLCSNVVGAWFAATPEGWRYMLMAGAAPAVILGYTMLFLPASPRWLMARQREGSARRMLRRLGVPDVDTSITEIKQSLEGSETKGSWRELLRPKTRYILFVGLGLMLFQQFSGIGIVINYGTTIFGMTGIAGPTGTALLTLGVGVVDVIATMTAILLLDRFGRKPLFLNGIAATVVCLLVLAFSFSDGDPHTKVDQWLAVLSLFIYVGAFSLSLGPVSGLIVSEIYPQRVRGMAMAFVMVANWVSQITIALTFPSLVAYLGPAVTFSIYAVIGVAGFLFCYFNVPETKGLTLEQIEEHWRAGDPPRQW
ncbi:MAG: sugar porter family MFS transporter [Alphaproteobacteria bacterium]|nr:sugar porter family MFS transporter [Alphaproteobacteria bacterium]